MQKAKNKAPGASADTNGAEADHTTPARKKRSKTDKALTQVARRDPAETSSAQGLFRCFEPAKKIHHEIDGVPQYEMKPLTKEDIAAGYTQPYKQVQKHGKPIPIKKNPGYDVRIVRGDWTIDFIVPEGLEWSDLKIYKALLALAYSQGKKVTGKTKSEEGAQMRLALEEENAADPIAYISTSYASVANEAGYNNDKNGRIGGTVIAGINDSIEKLYRVTIKATNNVTQKWHLSRLIGVAQGENKKKRLKVALNTRSAQVLFVGSAVGFTHLDMNELRAISSPSTGLIHSHLEGRIDPDSTSRISLVTCFSWVWAEKYDIKNTKHRKRMEVIRAAFAELPELGWKIAEVRDGVFSVQRPALTTKLPEVVALQEE